MSMQMPKAVRAVVGWEGRARVVVRKAVGEGEGSAQVVSV